MNSEQEDTNFCLKCLRRCHETRSSTSQRRLTAALEAWKLLTEAAATDSKVGWKRLLSGSRSSNRFSDCLMRTSLLLHHQREASRPLSPVCVLGVRLIQGASLFLLLSPACGNYSDPNLASLRPFMKWVASDAEVYKRCCHRRNKESTGKMSLSARRRHSADFNVRWRPSVTRLEQLSALVCRAPCWRRRLRVGCHLLASDSLSGQRSDIFCRNV